MPRSTWFKALLLFVALWAPLSQAETGWQPIQETIRKSDKDNRQYQAIRLDNGMVVLLVSDPQAVKSLSALVVPIGHSLRGMVLTLIPKSQCCCWLVGW